MPHDGTHPPLSSSLPARYLRLPPGCTASPASLHESQPLSPAEAGIAANLWHAVTGDPDAARLSTNDLARYVRAFLGEADPAAVAAERLKATLAWRREVGFRALCEGRGGADVGPPRHARYNELLPWRVYGLDAHGHPILANRFAWHDFSALSREFTVDEVPLHEAVRLDAMGRAAASAQAARGARVYKHVVIIDLETLTLRQFARHRAFLRQTIWAGSEHNPESTHCTYLVNAPLTFRAIWRVAGGWLNPRTLERVKILGRNKEAAREVMVASGVPVESMPEWCGGGHPGVDLGAFIRGSAVLPWEEVGEEVGEVVGEEVGEKVGRGAREAARVRAARGDNSNHSNRGTTTVNTGDTVASLGPLGLLMHRVGQPDFFPSLFGSPFPSSEAREGRGGRGEGQHEARERRGGGEGDEPLSRQCRVPGDRHYFDGRDE